MWEALLDWLFPPCCPGCGRGGGGDFCARCGASVRPLALEAPGDLRVYAAAAYEGPLRQAILHLKHGARTSAVPALASAMQRALPPDLPDAVVAVPAARDRVRLRGLHGPGLLGAALAQALRVPFRPGLLVPGRSLASQKDLSRPERLDNVRGGFLAAPCPGLRVLLVDDVMTTGATLGECARALRGAGARRVEAVVAAAVRTP